MTSTNDVTDATSAASSWASRESPEYAGNNNADKSKNSNNSGKDMGSNINTSNVSGSGKSKDKISSKLIKKRGGTSSSSSMSAVASASSSAADIPPPPPPLSSLMTPPETKKSPKVVGTLPMFPVLPPPGSGNITGPLTSAPNSNLALSSNNSGHGQSNSPNSSLSASNNAAANNIVNSTVSAASALTASNTTANNNNNNNNGSTTSTNPNSPTTSTTTYPLLVEIEEGTPAAEALKANADVRVSALHKFARSTKSQAVVRALKSAARTASGQPGHASDRRGAPPFVAPKGATGGADGTTGGTGVGGAGGGVVGGAVAGAGPLGNSTGSGASHLQSLTAGHPPPTILEAEEEGDSQGSGSRGTMGGESSTSRGGSKTGSNIAMTPSSPKKKRGMAIVMGGAYKAGNDDKGDLSSVDVAREGSGYSQDYHFDRLDDSIISNEDRSLTFDNLLPDDTDEAMAKPSATVQSLLLAPHVESGAGGMDGFVGSSKARQMRQSPLHSSLIKQINHHHPHSPHVTHAALPAAIAAACRAGEDMDRKRANSTGVNAMRIPPAAATAAGVGGTGAHGNGATTTTGSKSKFSSLFKSSQTISPPDHKDVGGELSTTPASTADAGLASPSQKGKHKKNTAENSTSPIIPVFHRHSTGGSQKFPSEISCADTEVHANMGYEIMQELEDLSDDELDSATLEAILSPGAGENLQSSPLTNELFIKKTRIDPVVVVVPDQERQQDFPIQEIGTSGEEAMNNQQPLLQQQEQASMKKKKSKKSFKNKKKTEEEDESFHFHGHKSVMKWVRRRKNKEQDKIPRSYVKGKVIDGKHELYTMSIAVMLGMRTSIGRTNLQMAETSHNEKRWLDNDDLMAVEKYVFRPRGTDITPPHQLSHTFKFKDYSPLAFAYLRRMFGVNEYEFLLSVCGNANYIEFQSNAKSGQFFFYSPDGKYMIKTMTNAESKFLRRILPHYFRHCAMNPNTLVAKFLGMYRVKLYHLRRNVKFMVMKSVYDTDKHLHQLFDVKGSTTGRDAKPGDAVKKDNDVRRTLPDGAFVLERGLREKLRKQVVLDTEWLRAMKIMDYSMLIGVHNIPHRSKGSLVGDRQVGHRRMASNSSARMASNDDGDERSLASYDASASHATLDHFLDDDDDGSYLDGAQNMRSLKIRQQAHDNSSTFKSTDAEDVSSHHANGCADAVLEQAIEDMYWPFHMYYDVQGRRRLNPIPESLLAEKKEEPNTDQHNEQSDKDGIPRLRNMFKSTHNDFSADADKKYNIPTFERPLSERKDAGFMMDLTDVEIPIKLTKPGAPHMVELCDGKIFYMGIIDILQQFNIRKRFEAKYRRLGGKGWEAASCVHPSIYADRFIRFFDEYTQRERGSDGNTAAINGDSGSNSQDSSKEKDE